MDSAIKKVVILGGGTAGWITAARLAYDHCATQEQGLAITLIESPDVRPIGVGEGSWPTLRITLREIGVSETEFIKECDVAFKQGSKFIGWCSGLEGDSYYHPFTPPLGLDSIDVSRAWQKYSSAIPFASAVCAQPQLCELGLAPKQIQTPDYAAFSNYGYHLNSDKFGAFLHKYCVEKLGVEYLQEHVTSINASDDGYIESLNCADGTELSGDLFVDCTGANALLIDKHYQAEFIDKSSVLFNNTALAVQVPYEYEQQSIASATLSTAQQHGWIWDIGLPTRRGTGHVYSNAYVDDESVWSALKSYIAKDTPKQIVDKLEPRKLSFSPGYRKTPWVKNCVAVGMSAGFVEPLEASAIAMIEVCSKTISNELPANRIVMQLVADRFNKRFVERWESVVEFLKLHYFLSKRNDSEYWKDNRDPDTVPQHLKDLLEIWKFKMPSTADFHQVLELFGPPSYQYVLYGMGFLPNPTNILSRWENEDIAMQVFKKVQDICKSGSRGLSSNRSLLNDIYKKQ